MPSKTFYTDTQKTDALSVKWGWNWKNLTIQYGGQEIGQIAGKKDLQKGKSFQLTPEKELYIRLSNAITPELELFINGQAVAGSGADPRHTLQQLYFMGLILGGLNIAIGVVGELMTNEFLLMLGAGFGSILFGMALIGLAFAIKKGSALAIMATMALWGLDILLVVYFASQGQDSPSTGGILMKLYFIYYLYRGISATKKLTEVTADMVAS